MIYAGQSVSLCAMEVLANTSRLPTGSIAIEIQIPDALLIRTLEMSALARGWDDPTPSDNHTRCRNELGSRGSDGHSIRSILNHSR